jgi:hypothetical protein
MRPQRREEGLVSTPVDDEVLVYDLERELGHHLDRVAAVVWQYCDGTHTVAELTAVTKRELGTPVEEAAVRHALALLAEADLLEEPEAVAKAGLSRRDALARMGTVAGLAVLPALASFTVPAPAAAQSGPGSTGPTGVTGSTGETGPTG